ncbi:hypothetical protein MRX96_004316 [Rhipicephalus microplus]
MQLPWWGKMDAKEASSSPRRDDSSSRLAACESLSNWIHCICVVAFDLELGQAMEVVLPSDAQLSEKEKSSICYLAFPDSNSGCMGGHAVPVPHPAVKDSNVRRGYFQKSLVVLTRLPLAGLFSRVLCLVAREYFRTSLPSLEAALRNLESWPAPLPGIALSLPLHGVSLEARIPPLQGLGSTLGSPSVQPGLDPVPSVHEVDLFRCLMPLLSHIQLLWELVLVAEPIVVMAPSPAVCSDTVLALGVTNPFFAKTLQHWPHVLRLGDDPVPDSPQKLKKGGQLRTLDSKPGLYTQHKPFLQRDKVLFKKLSKGVQTRRPCEVQSALLKRYLLELTHSFMIPLERYMASLMPLQRNISPYKGTPSLKPFNQDDFLRSLDTAGPQLTTGIKGDWAALYRKFFKSCNFIGWYQGRRKEASQKLQALHAEAISDADLLLWARDKEEVEVVDLVLRLKDKLVSGEKGSLPVTPQTMAKLRQHVQAIVSGLPEDLQQVLASSR